MGLMGSAFNTASKIAIAGRVKDLAIGIVEPKLSEYVRNLDAEKIIESSSRMEGFAELSDEDRARYEEAGQVLIDGCENLATLDNGEETVDMAMCGFMSNLAEECKDDPAKLAYYLNIDNKVGETMVDNMAKLNETIEEKMESGEDISPEDAKKLIGDATKGTITKAVTGIAGNVIEKISEYRTSQQAYEQAQEVLGVQEDAGNQQPMTQLGE